MPTDRWPRVGCPLLPALLRRSWSTERLPVDVAAAAGLPRSTTLGGLDDAAWEAVGDYRPLATYLRETVQRRVANQPGSELANEAVLTLPWPEGVEAAQVPFALRTRNVLGRLGRSDDMAWMLAVTGRELMAPQYSGPVVLLDFATIVEGMAQAHVGGKLVTRAEANEQVEALWAEFPIDLIPCDDPRLKLDLVGDTIGDALEGRGPRGAFTVYDLVGAVVAVRAALGRISTLDPHEALRDLARTVLRNRHADAVVRRLGWDSRGGCTLVEAAAEAGVSWQRIHQLEAKLVDGTAGRYWFLPGDTAAPVHSG